MKIAIQKHLAVIMINMPSSKEGFADGLRYTKPLCRLLHTLRVRYALDMIYTYSGEILIAVRLMACHIQIIVSCECAVLV
jgi:hypothetical protein